MDKKSEQNMWNIYLKTRDNEQCQNIYPEKQEINEVTLISVLNLTPQGIFQFMTQEKEESKQSKIELLIEEIENRMWGGQRDKNW